MFWTNVKRIIRSGFFNFSRNAFVSLSSILVMTITLLVIGSLIFLSAILHSSLKAIESQVDINVYFVTSAADSDITALQQKLEALPEVESVTYTTADQALSDFKTRHANDEFTLQALQELGDNPLGAQLNVKAKDPSQYQGIADFLQNTPALGSDGNSIIDQVSYYQHEDAIDKLNSVIAAADKLGTALTIFLILISILITFNTIRLSIFISREEIAVMRLVGASSAYIRGPFVIVGMIYGAVAGIVALLIFYPATLWLGKTTANFFIGMNVFSYYISNFAEIFGIIMLSGIFIGAVSSYLAVRKYLKV